MTNFLTITPELLSSIAGIALSLALAYIPGVAEFYAALTPVYKRLSMLFLLSATVGILYGLSCSGWIIFVACSKFSLLQLIACLVQALVANQSTFLLLPRRGVAYAETRSASEFNWRE